MTNTIPTTNQSVTPNHAERALADLADDMQGVMTSASEVLEYLTCGDIDPDAASAISHLTAIALKASADGPLEKMRSYLRHASQAGASSAS